MTDDSDRGLRALAKRLGLDPDRAIGFLSASEAADDVEAFVDADDVDPDLEAADAPGYVQDGDAFQDPEDAIERSQALGLDGNFHTVDDWFVPGETRQAYLDAVEAADAADDGGTADAGQVDLDGDDLDAQASGVITFEASAQQVLEAADADGPLTGVIWGAGDHDLALGGEPTPVRVPPETIPDTFAQLKEDIQAGEVTLGFDHPGPDSVAAQTGIVDIGQATGVALSADERHIVLTDSELTNQQAIEAADDGAFDSLDWSVVADAAVIRGEDGQPKREDGRILMGAARIRRIDAVDEGAVDAASIERDASALPDLKDEVQMVQEAAEAGLNQTDTDAVVQALKASATAYTDITDMTDFDPDDVDDIEAARQQLDAAASIIDDQEQQLDAARERADAFEGVLQAHDVDPDEFDDPQAAAQALIDEQTEDIRAEIAQVEADLAKFDTDDVDARASDLAGKTPSELQNLLNARKATAFDVQQKTQNRGAAAAQADQTGRASFSGGSDGNADAEADDVALQAMDGKDRIEADANGQSPAEFVQSKYGLNAANYQNADDLHGDIMAEIQGDA